MDRVLDPRRPPRGEVGLRKLRPEISKGLAAREKPASELSKIGETHMATRTSSIRNDYRCSIELNQAGKYCVRVSGALPRPRLEAQRFFFSPRPFDRAMKKLEEGLDFLQRQEEKLWFWGCGPRPKDMGFFG